MPDKLVQISKRTGTIMRVPHGETPVLELHLAEGQYVTSVELRKNELFYSERKTVDWSWTAYVVTPL